MTSKETAIRNAVDAAKAAAQVINDYGADSDEAAGAVEAAIVTADGAKAAGATNDEIKRG